MTLWHGRFSEGMHAAMREFSVSLATDIALLPYDLLVSAVWAEELARISVLSSDECTALQSALTTIAGEWSIPWPLNAAALQDATTVGLLAAWKPALNLATLPDEDIHSLVERRLTELLGATGAKIHTGRSRNDQVMTDLRLWLRVQGHALLSIIHTLCRSAVESASVHQQTVMPGYTHLQQAQPMLLAHYLLALVWGLQDDHARLADALARADFSPLGSGALAGTAYPIDRARVAKSLGFAGATPNSIAATSFRDECIEVASGCALLMTRLSRFAEDWILWSSQEFGFVTFGDSVTTGSSMMPQKKNPDAFELIRGKTARVIGALQNLLVQQKGAPLAYARDLQEDKPALFDAVAQTSLAVALFGHALESAQFHTDVMRARIDSRLYATELADYLVLRGVPFRQAHEQVARLVRETSMAGRALDSLPLAELQQYLPSADADIARCFDPAAALARRECIGGTGPQSVATQIAQCRAWLAHSAG